LEGMSQQKKRTSGGKKSELEAPLGGPAQEESVEQGGLHSRETKIPWGGKLIITGAKVNVSPQPWIVIEREGKELAYVTAGRKGAS